MVETKAIFIDWDKTLSISKFWSHWEVSEPKHYELVQKHFFGTEKETLMAWMRGQLRAEQVIARAAIYTGIDKKILLRELKKSCQSMQLLDPSIKDVIKKIRASGIEVAIATDNMDTFLRWTVPALGLDDLVDRILDSHTLGVLKSDVGADGSSAFFSTYIRNLGIKPVEAVLFDDNAGYIERFGLRYVQVSENRPLTRCLAQFLT